MGIKERQLKAKEQYVPYDGTHDDPDRIMLVCCRRSPLACEQLDEVFDSLYGYGYLLTKIDSYGDKHRELSLWDEDIPADFFTRELDEHCLIFRGTIAVHSAKDTPFPVTEGLEIYALTKGKSNTDSLVTRDGRTLAELPAGSKVATSSPNRRKQLLELRPDLEAVTIRGNIEERIAKVDSGEVDALIVATCALQRLDLMYRQAEELPFKTHPLQGKLAVVGSCDGEYKDVFKSIDVRRRYGELTIVGAGPGNLGSLTLDGAEALRKATVVFYDDLISPELVEHFSKKRTQWIYVGKRCGKHSYEQSEINEMLLDAVVKGRRVVRLKGGDPMVFAHVREEIDYVQMGTLKPVRVVPGVTAGIAAAALSQTPLTQRGVASSVSFALGHGSEIQTPNTDTIVYYMCGNNIARIATSLLSAGRPASTPVVVGCDVTRPGQVFLYSTLDELQFAAVKNSQPVIMIVGAAAACDEHVRIFQRTLYTGCPPSEYMIERIYSDPFNEYAELIYRIPTNALVGLVPGHMCSPERYDWVIFTSNYTVKCYKNALEAVGRRMKEAFLGVNIGSVGPVTSSALRFYNLKPTMESATQSASGILDYFRREVHTPQRILLPHSDIALRLLSDGLKAMGHQVVDAAVYKTRPNPDAHLVDLDGFKKVVFSSPSGVDAYIDFYGKLPEGKLLLSKGETTLAKVIKELENEKI